MPKTNVYDMTGNVVGEIELNDAIFGIEVNEHVMHLAVQNQLANKRQGTQSTKTKSEVSGGGIKPWRQKGTGRARQGSTRSAQWIKGGIVLGPKPRSYSYTLPKKVKRLAMKSALTAKANENEIIVLESLSFNDMKTKNMVAVLNKLGIDNTALVVLAEKDENIVNSARNIENVQTAYVNTINVYDILKYSKFVITKAALEKVEEVYA